MISKKYIYILHCFFHYTTHHSFPLMVLNVANVFYLMTLNSYTKVITYTLLCSPTLPKLHFDMVQSAYEFVFMSFFAIPKKELKLAVRREKNSI